jgi:hypothetical protein
MAQSVAVEQLVRQAVPAPLQARPFGQAVAVPGAHVPLPSQAGWVSLAAEQVAVPQVTVVPG